MIFNQIKSFIDKVSLAETKRTNSIVLSISDARILRDEFCKLLADLNSTLQTKNNNDMVEIQIKGGSFK